MKFQIIPETVSEIDENAFNECESLKKIKVNAENASFCDDGILFNKAKTKLIKFPQNKSVKFYQIPNTIRVIGYGAFQNCDFIEQVKQIKQERTGIIMNGDQIIPFLVNFIDKQAFAYCNSIKNVQFTNYDMDICSKCFYLSGSIESIKVTN